MSKYIDADKLIEAIEEIKKAEYENCGGVNAKTKILQEVQELIASLQQGRSETPSGEEVMTMCNQILIDWVKEGKTPEEREQREQAHIRFFELYDEYMQEQPEVDLEKFTEKIKTFQGRYKHPENISVKGAMAFMARMFYQYPNVARLWYDSLPKVTMD